MIFRKFKNPLAFNNHWHPLPKFHKNSDFNFSRYIYKINDMVFDKDSEEFRDALSKIEMLKKLGG